MKQVSNSLFADRNISWHGLEEWISNNSNFTLNWDAIKELKATTAKALGPYKLRYMKLENDWKLKLIPICGVFYEHDWQRFRPLRWSREEDWSDWLAWLLETSATGLFAEILFGSLMDCDASWFRLPEKKVERELWTENGERRADIVAKWNNNLITHIEIKLGDQNFEKTFETSQSLRCRWGMDAKKWKDAILIPEASRAAWKNAAEKHTTEFIEEILWNDVVHAIRKCLWEEKESIIWRVWAWSFCCAVENRILNLRRPEEFKPGLSDLAMAARWVEILAINPTEEPL